MKIGDVNSAFFCMSSLWIEWRRSQVSKKSSHLIQCEILNFWISCGCWIDRLLQNYYRLKASALLGLNMRTSLYYPHGKNSNALFNKVFYFLDEISIVQKVTLDKQAHIFGILLADTSHQRNTFQTRNWDLSRTRNELLILFLSLKISL